MSCIAYFTSKPSTISFIFPWFSFHSIICPLTAVKSVFQFTFPFFFSDLRTPWRSIYYINSSWLVIFKATTSFFWIGRSTHFCHKYHITSLLFSRSTQSIIFIVFLFSTLQHSYSLWPVLTPFPLTLILLINFLLFLLLRVWVVLKFCSNAIHSCFVLSFIMSTLCSGHNSHTELGNLSSRLWIYYSLSSYCSLQSGM